jgi:hypothetical protein
MAFAEILFGINDPFDRLFKLDAVKGHIPSASTANDPYVAADAKHLKKLSSARVLLFQLKRIANRYFQYLHT